jgi:hypothetical protein
MAVSVEKNFFCFALLFDMFQITTEMQEWE